MRTHAVLLATTVLMGCECTKPPMQVPVSEVRVEPTSLDFGPVAIGASHRLSFSVTNTGRASAAVTLAVSPPFSLSKTSLIIGGGDSEAVDVTFTPTEEGAVSATVEGVGVTLAAVGLPACSAASCTTSGFDLETRSCVSTRSPDGAPCTAACFSPGSSVCSAGQCVGKLGSACDDSNACTIDACGADGGCLHLPRQPTIRSGCEVASCDPSTGFRFEPVEDGTPCGEPTCAQARVCINGTCQSRARTQSPDDCRYTHVCSGTYRSGVKYYGCAATRSGKLRCWGNPEWLGRDGGSSGPAFVEGVADVDRPVCLPFGGIRWLDTQHRLLPPNPFADAGLASLDPEDSWRDVRADDDGVGGSSGYSALSTRGELFSGSYPLSLSRLSVDAGVRALCGVDYFITDQGHLRWKSNPHRNDESDVKGCAGSLTERVSLLRDGGVIHSSFGGRDIVVDGGASIVGAGMNGPTVFQGSTAITAENGFIEWPFAPREVTEGRNPMCGISIDGALACEGVASGSPLSEEPDLPLLVLDGGARDVFSYGWRNFEGHMTFITTSGQAVRYQSSSTLALAPGNSTLEPWTAHGFSDVDAVTSRCAKRGTQARCVLDDQSVAAFEQVASLIPYSASKRYDPTVVTVDGRIIWSDGGVLREGVLPGSYRDNCAFPTDAGTVDCFGVSHVLPGPARVDSLSGRGGCFVSPAFEGWCFSVTVPMQRMPLRFGVRLISGDATSGCAVSGLNGVQCWGLGRFRNVAFDETITAIAVNPSRACAVTLSGRGYCWGDNPNGELGVRPDDFRGVHLVTQ